MRTDTPPLVRDYINPNWKIGIVTSSFYKEEIDSLAEGAIDELLKAGIVQLHCKRYDVPGSFEIPLIGSALAKKGEVDALIGLGIIVEGQTQHARLLAEQTARGIMDVQLQYGIPFAFEVLYVDALTDAQNRCSGSGNKGKEAASAVLHALATIEHINS
ncbi:MAG: 6,7-dimethyl-8-ribityllumazine synthase [bacterium]|nr:6,7-dimethyl-8-ribityllumazine synthase [bacterium]